MNIQDRIVPVPQRVTCLEGEGLCLSGAGYVLCHPDFEAMPLAQRACSRLKEALPRGGDTPIVVTLALGTPSEEIPNAEQGYLLKAEAGRITVTGFGEAGLFYGVTTLLQLLQEESLPAVEILDYPSLKTRGHFIETRYGTDLMELEDWKQVVDEMVQLKENQLTVSVYGCWQVQFDNRVSEYVYTPFEGYPDLKTPVYKKYYSPKAGKWVNEVVGTPMYEKDFLGQLMAYGKENGVQVIPMVNSLGHNTLIPRLYPEVSAKDEEGNPACTGYCTSNPKTYELIFDLYDQLIDRYCAPNGIDAFDIGMDEVRDGRAYLPGDIGNLRSPWCRCPECAKKTKAQIIIGHGVKLIEHLKEKGMKTVYMYNDMVVEHKTVYNNGQPEDRAAMFHAALEEKGLLDVACLDWWSYRELRETFHFTTIHPELGLRSTMKPWNGYYNWAFLVNSVPNNYHASKIAMEEGAEGMRSYSTWDGSYHRNNQTQADYAWNHAGTGMPSVATARYVRRHFPTAAGIANTAFLLMEEATRWRNTKSENNYETSRHDMLMAQLNPYQYTYYNKNLEYPRNYPGEQVPKLRQDWQYRQELSLTNDLATQAAELFAQVAETPGCDKTLALRYRYEALNYSMLCRDFITVMEMDDLAQRYHKTQDPALLEAIAAAARKQKEARICHLALLEQTKEHYLIPGNGRIQSLPLQYFADVEAYITETPAEQLKLDFADMRHIASEQFYNLR